MSAYRIQQEAERKEPFSKGDPKDERASRLWAHRKAGEYRDPGGGMRTDSLWVYRVGWRRDHKQAGSIVTRGRGLNSDKGSRGTRLGEGDS